MDINYVRKKDNIVYINEIIQKKTINVVLNEIAKEEFKTIETIKKISREKLKIKRDVPIFINDEIIFIILRETKDDFVYINIKNILNIFTTELFQTIFFKDNSLIKLNISKYALGKMKEKIELVNKLLS